MVCISRSFNAKLLGYEIKFTHILDEDDWYEKLLKSSCLSLVEVYSSWCGPCTVSWSFVVEMQLQLGGKIVFILDHFHSGTLVVTKRALFKFAVKLCIY